MTMNEMDEVLNETRKKADYAEQMKARRDRCYALIDRAALNAVSTAERLQQFLAVGSRFERYSLNNNLLILAQKPNATRIRDYDSWEKEEKQVRKGAKSFEILEPHTFTAADGSQQVGYNPKKMFDNADLTEPDPIPKPVSYDPKLLIRALVNGCPAPIYVKEDYPKERTAGAYYDFAENKIYARAGMTPDEMFPAIAAAVVHAELAREQTDYRTAEQDFQARCAAHILCRKYGVPTKYCAVESIPPRFAGYDAAEVKAELAKIHDPVKAISERMADVLEKKRQKEPKEKPETGKAERSDR